MSPAGKPAKSCGLQPDVVVPGGVSPIGTLSGPTAVTFPVTSPEPEYDIVAKSVFSVNVFGTGDVCSNDGDAVSWKNGNSNGCFLTVQPGTALIVLYDVVDRLVVPRGARHPCAVVGIGDGLQGLLVLQHARNRDQVPVRLGVVAVACLRDRRDRQRKRRHDEKSDSSQGNFLPDTALPGGFGMARPAPPTKPPRPAP